jgi:hypothetical protein
MYGGVANITGIGFNPQPAPSVFGVAHWSVLVMYIIRTASGDLDVSPRLC